MKLFGCYNALSVDGGGSAAMVMQACTDNAVQLSSPIQAGIPGNERVVPNHFGVIAKPVSGFISDLSVAPGRTTARITWNTDSPASSRVAYGLTTSYGNVTPLGTTPVTEHSVNLAGLEVSSNYFFRVVSAAGGTNHAVDSCFTTVDDAPFGQIFDVTNVWRYSWAILLRGLTCPGRSGRVRSASPTRRDYCSIV